MRINESDKVLNALLDNVSSLIRDVEKKRLADSGEMESAKINDGNSTNT